MLSEGPHLKPHFIRRNINWYCCIGTCAYNAFLYISFGLFSSKVDRPLRVGPRQQPEAVEGPARLLLHQKLHHGGSASHAPQHESFEYFDYEHANQRKLTLNLLICGEFRSLVMKIPETEAFGRVLCQFVSAPFCHIL